MKRLVCLFFAMLLLLTACGEKNPNLMDVTESQENEEENTNLMDVTESQENEEENLNLVDVTGLQAEINKVLETASYENLEILFESIDNYKEQDLIIANTYSKEVSEGMSYQEAMTWYVEKIFPKLLDLEFVDTNLVYDVHTFEDTNLGHRIRTYGKDYADVLLTLDEYESVPELVYSNNDTWTELYYMDDWKYGLYLTQGKLGSMAPSMSSFGAYAMIEDEKKYDCRLDDLSDSYLLMDGEKTVAEAKEEAEKYLDERYQLYKEDNEIRNVVHSITAGKIIGTESYAYKVYRTISYNDIPIREMPSSSMMPDDEFAFMGEGAMCESNKLDVIIGIINSFAKPEKQRVITKVIPFQEIMDRVAYYLTGGTRFQLLNGCIEYRMYIIKEETYQLVPYWCFIAKDPNDDSMIKIYVDMENGEIEHFMY